MTNVLLHNYKEYFLQLVQKVILVSHTARPNTFRWGDTVMCALAGVFVCQRKHVVGISSSFVCV